MLYLVSTPIGNLQDISLRALQALSEADIVICEDTRVAKKLYSLLSSKNLVTKTPDTFIPFHSHNEDLFLSKLDKKIFDKNVLFFSDAGMPCISDPGAKLVLFCQRENIQYDVLPGASALLTAFCMSGFDETQFYFHGFLPHKSKNRLEELQQIIHTDKCTILYESTHRINNLAQELKDIFPDGEIFAIKEMTKIYQTFYKGECEGFYQWLKNRNINGEWVVIIKGKSEKKHSITLEELKLIDLPPKVIAKIESKITGKNIKECYNLALLN